MSKVRGACPANDYGQVEHGGIGEGWTAIKRGDVLDVELYYPKRKGQPNPEGKVQCIEVGICDVRAADSIRISYDFDRDGYVIWQAKNWNEDQGEKPLEWQEVAFISAWALEPVEG